MHGAGWANTCRDRPNADSRRGECHVILHLIRHGETEHNRIGVGLGHDDVALTELGKAQARALAERMEDAPLDAVFTSPLCRARQAADAIALAHGLAVEARDELLELDIGDTEGLPFAAVRERWPDFAARWLGEEVADAVMPGGESLRQLAARLVPLLGEIQGRPAESVVAVVAHNFVIKTILCQLLGVDLNSFRVFEVGLASVSTVSLRGGRATVVALNDTCHLGGLNLDPWQRSL